MNKTALYVQNEASKKHNPCALTDYLTHTEDGTVIVDRFRLLQNKDDERLFYVVLNKDYGWDYRYPETTTIYFEVEDGRVYGGVYDSDIGVRSRRVVAVEHGLAKVYEYNLYCYDNETMAEIIRKINF